MQFSVISRIRHFFKKPRLLEYYRTYSKPVIGYGVLLYGCNSENRLNPFFVLQKRIQRQVCLKLVISVCRTVYSNTSVNFFCLLQCWAPQLFLTSVRSVLPTEHPNFFLSAKYLMFKPEKFNLTYFLCKVNPASLVVIFCVTELELWSIAW